MCKPGSEGLQVRCNQSKKANSRSRSWARTTSRSSRRRYAPRLNSGVTARENRPWLSHFVTNDILGQPYSGCSLRAMRSLVTESQLTSAARMPARRSPNDHRHQTSRQTRTAALPYRGQSTATRGGNLCPRRNARLRSCRKRSSTSGGRPVPRSAG